ncbi:UNVERIFIED_ORG: hypothetical protein J2W38_006257 [Variovorax paradoxus]|nr:hypothetical protein [Variovorax paradoxus]
MPTPHPLSHLRPIHCAGALLTFTSLSAQADPAVGFFRLLGWTAALGFGQILAWTLGLALVFLVTFFVPGPLLRALVRAPLLWALSLLLAPRLRIGPWSWSSVLLGLATAALGAWLIERRWNEDDVDLDLS